ncbi:MAG: hypothetical protein A4S09_06775 [Proteobacteria bacterium SG_bin7]|nr:MAG: hypothetical protein A4S09_06775 [Proteobacteria bacterium SG_bin7]
MDKPRSHLSESFLNIENLCTPEEIELGELFENLSSRGHAFPSLVFSVPFFFPLPLPGLSVLLGIIIMIGGIGLALKKKPFFPIRWRKKKIKTSILKKVAHFGLRASIVIEKITIPTRNVLFKSPMWLSQASGILIVICGFLLALPLPPGTNFPPAISIFFLSLGVLEENLALIFVGFVAFGANIALFYGILFGLFKAWALI